MNTRTARLGRGVLTLSVLGVGLLAAGCGGDDSGDATSTVTVTRDVTTDATPQSDAPTSTGAPSTGSTTTGAPTTGNGSPVDAVGALTAALDAKPGSYAVEVDEEDGRVWEITLAVNGEGVELSVSQSTGEVVDEHPTRLDAEQQDAPTVTAAEAVEAALAEKPGRLDSLDLDRENGRVAWEATVVDGADEWNLWIDPTSGEVLQSERDD